MARADGSGTRAAARTSRVVTYAEVVEEAIHCFLDDSSLHVQVLAHRLAISRATLYRVIADQDRLLGDVLWVLTARTMAMAERQATGTGVDRLMHVSRSFQSMVRDFRPLRRFTEIEPDRAFRVLFTPAGGIHARVVAYWTRLFRRAQDDGEVALPFDAEQFAEMFVRLGETMLWSGLIGARAVDVTLWEEVQRSLFTLAVEPHETPSER